jgi:hypothetical protein
VQEHRAASAGDAWRGVVVDFDDEIVEMIVTFQAVAIPLFGQANRSIVTPIIGIFAPSITSANRADR